MIVVDIETSNGNNFERAGVWQIGALDLNNPSNTFFDEGRIDEEDTTTEDALKAIGKTEEELRDRNKQSQKELIEKFFSWCEKIGKTNFLCHNPQFDYAILYIRAARYRVKFPVDYRCFDLHSVAQAVYSRIKGELLIEAGKSGFYLGKILEFCGVEDPRIIINNGKIVKEGDPHNGLTDAKLEAECFYRLICGRNLLPEYSRFEIPDYLKEIMN
ncbi:MAG: hypothetical protein KKD18_06490 [Nanoarchaeota archaeon]|nr:hypothetical protein [Nanoarchaeota archaeon]MBU0978041.1 hypothetical protein [Nanoarchaeota archaeon]